MLRNLQRWKLKKQPMGSHIDCKMLIAKGSSIPENHHRLSTHWNKLWGSYLVFWQRENKLPKTIYYICCIKDYSRYGKKLCQFIKILDADVIPNKYQFRKRYNIGKTQSF